MKTYITVLPNGNIVTVTETNDPTFSPIMSEGDIFVDITNYKRKDEVKNNPSYFYFKDNKISEKNEVKKRLADEERKMPEPINKLQDLEERLKKIEKKLD
jgi:vacuolar-type H+-ATPase subunit I/STV1